MKRSILQTRFTENWFAQAFQNTIVSSLKSHWLAQQVGKDRIGSRNIVTWMFHKGYVLGSGIGPKTPLLTYLAYQHRERKGSEICHQIWLRPVGYRLWQNARPRPPDLVEASDASPHLPSNGIANCFSLVDLCHIKEVSTSDSEGNAIQKIKQCYHFGSSAFPSADTSLFFS